MEFLGCISKRTDYELCVKTHPDSLLGNFPIIDELLKKYPKFSLLSHDVSHHQSIDGSAELINLPVGASSQLLNLTVNSMQ